jgi:hypothetical protein
MNVRLKNRGRPNPRLSRDVLISRRSVCAEFIRF